VTTSVQLRMYPVTNAGNMKVDMWHIQTAAELVGELLRVRGVGCGDFYGVDDGAPGSAI
jgi:hypothetical protein